MIEDLPGWVRLAVVLFALLLIPAICLAGRLLQWAQRWREHRPRRGWRRA